MLKVVILIWICAAAYILSVLSRIDQSRRFDHQTMCILVAVAMAASATLVAVAIRTVFNIF
jgi:hypothetical protein